LCNLIISEFNFTQEFTDEIGELRLISGHVLRATRVQIPEDDLDNLHSLREVDGILIFVDPQDLLGFLEYTNLTTGLGDSESRTIGFLECTSLVVVILVKGHAFPTIVKVRPVIGRDLLALVESLTPVECNTRLLEAMFEVESIFVFSVDVSDSISLTFLSFFLGVTATN
ncbi:hypothetical protein Tco_0112888, partial [Tanacetum coccineum]